MSEKDMQQRRSSDAAAALIDRREAELRKKAKTPSELRNCRQQAAMEWDAHIGYIDKRDLPKGWKDPYAKLDKSSKAKPKTTKAKAKK
jgi:hypothetical protein|nr:MAG TPA: hypothetical protein [Caudoviricetes sp.]